MGLDPHVHGSSRSETRGLIAAIIDSFNETGNPPVALVQRAMAAAGHPWQNQHIRWKDDGTCVTAAPSLSAREPTPGTRANAPESIDHAHPPRPASPTPQDQRKRPREDVPALGDLPSAPATKRKTNGPSDAVESRPPVVVSQEWSPDSDPRLGRIFRLRVDRDGNPRGDDVFADDAYPLRWVRLVTTEHQLAFGNRPSGAYVACATEAKSWEAANAAFSRRESRGRKSRGGGIKKKRSSIVFYESLHLEFLESKRDVEYLDLHRYPHPGAASVPPGLADLAAVATADATADGKSPPAAPGSVAERVARRASRHPPPPPFSKFSKEGRVTNNTNTNDACSKRGTRRPVADGLDSEKKGLANRVAPPEPRDVVDCVVRVAKPTGTDDPPVPPVPQDPTREEVRALRARLERVARRLRAEREERRLNETRLAAALRETRRALERAVAERETQTDGVIRF